MQGLYKNSDFLIKNQSIFLTNFIKRMNKENGRKILENQEMFEWNCTKQYERSPKDMDTSQEQNNENINRQDIKIPLVSKRKKYSVRGYIIEE